MRGSKPFSIDIKTCADATVRRNSTKHCPKISPMSGTSLSNSMLLPHDALDLMEETYSSSFFETEPLYHFDDLCSNSPSQLSGQEMWHLDRPSTLEHHGEPGDSCKSEQHLPEHPLRDKNIPAPSSKPSRKNSIKVKVLTTILSQSGLWHNLPMVRESGILGELFVSTDIRIHLKLLNIFQKTYRPSK